MLLSLLMHDIKWLRIFNMSGGLISLIYAICVNTMPVVVLNSSLILINGIQLMRILREERKAADAIKNVEAEAYDIEENRNEESK